MKIILTLLAVIQIIAGIILELVGANGRDVHYAMPGALFVVSGSFLLYLIFVHSGKD